MTARRGRHRSANKQNRPSVSDRAQQAANTVARSLQAGSLTLDEVERICAGHETTVKRVWSLLGRRWGKRLRVVTIRGTETWALDK